MKIELIAALIVAGDKLVDQLPPGTDVSEWNIAKAPFFGKAGGSKLVPEVVKSEFLVLIGDGETKDQNAIKAIAEKYGVKNGAVTKALDQAGQPYGARRKMMTAIASVGKPAPAPDKTVATDTTQPAAAVNPATANASPEQAPPADKPARRKN